MSSAGQLMTAGEYASHRGVSDSYVRRLRRDGRLVLRDGQIDVLASDAALDATGDPLRGGKSDRGAADMPPAGGGAGAGDLSGGSLREAMRRERWAKARQAELELGRLAKQLVEVRHVERVVFTLARQTLQRLRAIPARVSPALAAELDPRLCEALIEDEIRKVAEDLERGSRGLLGADEGADSA